MLKIKTQLNKTCSMILLLLTLLLLISTIFCAQLAIASLPPQNETQDDCLISAQDKIIEVPKQAETIQEAINKITTKGIVLVEPGTFRENIIVPEGKKIILQGAGAKKTRIRPQIISKPTISIGPNAHACINGFTIRGGSTGISAGEFIHNQDDNLSSPKRAALVSLKFTNIESADNGLLLNAEKVILNEGRITRNFNLGAGIFSPDVHISGTDFVSNLGAGITLSYAPFRPCFVETSPSSSPLYMLSISNIDISDNDGTGLTFCGPSEVLIRDSSFSHNKSANIAIIDQTTGATLLDQSYIEHAIAVDERYGDGLSIFNSPNVNIISSYTVFNERAGIFFSNSGGEVNASFILFNRLSIALESGATPIISDSTLIYGNEQNEIAIGLGLVPAPPPPPLEPPDD